jgi:hypothetical protein
MKYSKESLSSEVEYGSAPGYYSSKTVEKRDNKSYNQVLFDVAEGITGNLLQGKNPSRNGHLPTQGDQIKNRPLPGIVACRSIYSRRQAR